MAWDDGGAEREARREERRRRREERAGGPTGGGGSGSERAGDGAGGRTDGGASRPERTGDGAGGPTDGGASGSERAGDGAGGRADLRRAVRGGGGKRAGAGGWRRAGWLALAGVLVAVVVVAFALRGGAVGGGTGGPGAARASTPGLVGPAPAPEAGGTRTGADGRPTPQPHDWGRVPAVGAQVALTLRRPPRSGLLVEAADGHTLWRHDPELRLPIASVTKMMTALLVAERTRPRDAVAITPEALAYTGSGIGMLPRGRRAQVETLLYGLLLPSGNDAAIALAQHVGGSVPRFVRMMNARARQLGLACTRFASPSGIVDAGNWSCAPDLALLARALLAQPRLARIVRTPLVAMPLPIRGGRVWLANHNPLLRLRYAGADGVKTGFTDAAGRCFVASATRRGRRLIVVLLNSPDPGAQAARLLDAGFALRAG